MNKMNSQVSTVGLPDDLRLVSAAVVRAEWGISEPTLWRAEKSGKLRALRIGRKRYYRLSQLREFLDVASQMGSIQMPWTKIANPSDVVVSEI